MPVSSCVAPTQRAAPAPCLGLLGRAGVQGPRLEPAETDWRRGATGRPAAGRGSWWLDATAACGIELLVPASSSLDGRTVLERRACVGGFRGLTLL